MLYSSLCSLYILKPKTILEVTFSGVCVYISCSFLPHFFTRSYHVQNKKSNNNQKHKCFALASESMGTESKLNSFCFVVVFSSSSGFQNVPKIIHPPPSQHSHSSCLVIPPLAQTRIWRWPLASPPHWSTPSTPSPRPASASPVPSTPVPITRTLLVHFLISLPHPMSSSLQIS